MAITKVYSFAKLDSESRCDAEHIAAPILVEKNYQYGSDVALFTQYGTSKQLNENGKGFPVLRLNEFEQMFIQSPEKCCNLINESVYQQLRLSKGDVLVCRTNGNPHLVGKAAVVMEDTDCAYASYVFKVRPNHRISPQLLTVFLNSKGGRSEIERHQMISIQTNFSPERFKKCRVPCFSSYFQSAISDLVDRAYKSLQTSKAQYSAAEATLLNALGLNDFTPSASKFSIRGMAESFSTTNRIDAEYYQPRFDSWEKALNTTETVHSLCKVYDGKFVPHKGEYKYIELANIGTAGNVTGATVAPFESLPSRARRLIKAGQVIVSSIEGSLQSCALITDDYDGAICSTGFYVIDSDKLNSETLLVLFKSPPIQALLKKRCSGTILTAISKGELENMPIPKVDRKTQGAIAQKVQRSFALRKQSEQLLGTSKRAVEMAIEDGEAGAIDWLQERSV